MPKRGWKIVTLREDVYRKAEKATKDSICPCCNRPIQSVAGFITTAILEKIERMKEKPS
jgi:hypothetical protein